MTGPQPGGQPQSRPPIVPAAPRPAQHQDDELASIGLINDAEASAAEHKIRAISGNAATVRKDAYKRTPFKSGQGVCRVRSFHGRLSIQGLEYMDNQINEWLDAHPEVEVKLVTSQVGTFEGKIREPALVLNLWY